MKENQEIKICFVCGAAGKETGFTLNTAVMMPVCDACKGTDEEKRKETELLDSLADGLFCGCI
jgi:hypothetical protein